jgi:hypothetical protein
MTPETPIQRDVTQPPAVGLPGSRSVSTDGNSPTGRWCAIAVDGSWSDSTLDELLGTISVFRVDDAGILHLSITDIDPWLAVLPRWSDTKEN